jgi:hypothetical protein
LFPNAVSQVGNAPHWFVVAEQHPEREREGGMEGGREGGGRDSARERTFRKLRLSLGI